jgi:dCMP deaminase
MMNDHCVRTLHAEQNAIIQAAQHGVSTHGCTMYVTHRPCLICTKMIINAGLVRVVYESDYPDISLATSLSVEFFAQAGVTLQRIGRDPETP